MERLRPQPQPCSDQHWRELVFGMNSRADRVLIRNDSLKDVTTCHTERLELPAPKLEAQEEGDKYTSVGRDALFGFVQDHGAVCGRTL